MKTELDSRQQRDEGIALTYARREEIIDTCESPTAPTQKLRRISNEKASWIRSWINQSGRFFSSVSYSFSQILALSVIASFSFAHLLDYAYRCQRKYLIGKSTESRCLNLCNSLNFLLVSAQLPVLLLVHDERLCISQMRGKARERIGLQTL